MCLVIRVYDNGSLAVSKTVSGGSNPSTRATLAIGVIGNTPDSDSVVLGSSPRSPAKRYVMQDDKILEWIHRRFPHDSNWLNGNCYQFALLLNSTFEGEIVYDPIDGHFLFLASNGQFYDWSGVRIYNGTYQKAFVKWADYRQEDQLHYDRVMRDCAY